MGVLGWRPGWDSTEATVLPGRGRASGRPGGREVAYPLHLAEGISYLIRCFLLSFKQLLTKNRVELWVEGPGPGPALGAAPYSPTHLRQGNLSGTEGRSSPGLLETTASRWLWNTQAQPGNQDSGFSILALWEGLSTSLRVPTRDPGRAWAAFRAASAPTMLFDLSVQLTAGMFK